MAIHTNMDSGQNQTIIPADFDGALNRVMI